VFTIPIGRVSLTGEGEVPFPEREVSPGKHTWPSPEQTESSRHLAALTAVYKPILVIIIHQLTFIKYPEIRV